jgi:hypothetical protein
MIKFSAQTKRMPTPPPCYQCGAKSATVKCKCCRTMFCGDDCMRKSWQAKESHRRFCRANGKIITAFLAGDEVDATFVAGDDEDEDMDPLDASRKRKRVAPDKQAAAMEPAAKCAKMEEAEAQKKRLADFVVSRKDDMNAWRQILFDLRVSDLLSEKDQANMTVAFAGRFPEMAGRLARNMIEESPNTLIELCAKASLVSLKYLTHYKAIKTSDFLRINNAPMYAAFASGNVELVDFLIHHFPVALIGLDLDKVLRTMIAHKSFCVVEVHPLPLCFFLFHHPSTYLFLLTPDAP